MNAEELAFFNQQLAGMLKSGLPLEGALKELSKDLRAGPLREEITRLEHDLSQGKDLGEAIQDRNFPPLYQRLITIGVRSGQLESTLLLLADYYHRTGLLWNRLKGVILYPLITLIATFALSLFLAYSLNHIPVLLFETQAEILTGATNYRAPLAARALSFLVPCVSGTLLLAIVLALTIPSLRQKAAWRLPGFRDANLAHSATAISTLLRSGLTISDALVLARDLERNQHTKRDLSTWTKRIADGKTSFSNIAQGSQTFPPLFIWLVASSGESIGDGFAKAGQLYQRRADYRTDLFMTAALPVSVLFIGSLILLSLFPIIRFFTQIISAIDSLGVL